MKNKLSLLYTASGNKNYTPLVCLEQNSLQREVAHGSEYKQYKHQNFHGGDAIVWVPVPPQ